MKQIGTTNNGLILLEAHEREVNALKALRLAVKGKTIPQIAFLDCRNGELDEDIIQIINAVMEWIQIADRANELRNLADKIDAALKMPKGDADGKTAE